MEPAGEVTYRGYTLVTWGIQWELWHGNDYLGMAQTLSGAKSQVDEWMDAP